MSPPKTPAPRDYPNLAEAIPAFQSSTVLPSKTTFAPIPPQNTPIASASEDEVYNYDSLEDIPDPASITIHINASMLIEGTGNTIVIPQKRAHDPNDPPTHARVQSITAAVLSALRSYDLTVYHDPMERPVEVYVDASLRIRGNENKIYNGKPKARDGPSQSQTEVAEGDADASG